MERGGGGGGGEKKKKKEEDIASERSWWTSGVKEEDRALEKRLETKCKHDETIIKRKIACLPIPTYTNYFLKYFDSDR